LIISGGRECVFNSICILFFPKILKESDEETCTNLFFIVKDVQSCAKIYRKRSQFSDDVINFCWQYHSNKKNGVQQGYSSLTTHILAILLV
jgi:hypothetical protein